MKHPHSKKLLSLGGTLAALLAFVLLLALVYRFDNKYTFGPPYGEGGICSFTEAGLHRPLPLVDGWLLDGQEVFIGQYSNFSFLPGRGSPFGEGVYELKLRYEGPPRTLLLELPQIFTEYKLFINGVAAGGGTTLAVPVGDGDTLLRLETVNRSHYYSGLTYPPMLGTAESMGRLGFVRTLIYAAAVVSALTLALFSLSLWLSRERDGLFLHFGALCLAFAIHCLHPFVWQLGLSGTLWYAIEDTSWLLVLCEAAAVAAISAGLNQKPWYGRLLRPVALFGCVLSVLAVIFIIPSAPGFVNFYGHFMDWYKLLIWAFLAFSAGVGLSGEQRSAALFVLTAAGILGVSLFSDFWDANKFEPIYGLWQEEYAGVALVLVFGALMARRSAALLRQRDEVRSLRLQNRFAAESAEQLRESMREVRGVKHELNHHIDALAALCAFGDWPRLGEYLDTLRAQKEALPTLQYASHFLVNAILASHLGPAQQKGVRVVCHAALPETLGIPDADLCSLLSNLLSNAAEACAALPKEAQPFIDVELTVRNGLFSFSCVNSALFADSIGPFPTTKGDAESHGLGIPAMERMAERYNGAVSFRREDGRFIVKGVLAFPQ